jgi:predicted acylesterase/phospholipase RssA
MDLPKSYQEIKQKIDDILSINKRTNPYKYLTISGGGMRAICSFGALDGLIQNKLLIRDQLIGVSASSAGALLSFLYVIGYDPSELYEFVCSFNLSALPSVKLSSLLTSFGIDSGDNLRFVFIKMMDAKGVSKDITFDDLFKLTNIKFCVAVTNLNKCSVEYYSYDTTPSSNVLDAVLASCKLPIYFQPSKAPNGDLLVDGGCIDNYPIHIFDQWIDDTVGIYTSSSTSHIQDINNIEDYLKRIIMTAMKGIIDLGKRGYEKQTISIEIDLDILNFNIDETKIKDLYDHGFKTMMAFIGK